MFLHVIDNSILSQGVQISATSEILYLILGNYECNTWNCVHYSTWTLWKSMIYVFVSLLPCLQGAPVALTVMPTFCSWDHFETHEHSSVVSLWFSKSENLLLTFIPSSERCYCIYLRVWRAKFLTARST